jgi:DNA-binding GntR family transcriptional regulator
MIEQLMGQVERFVRRAGGMERRAAVDRAYTEILDSLEAGDVPDARGRLDRLLRETGEFVLDGGESAGS